MMHEDLNLTVFKEKGLNLTVFPNYIDHNWRDSQCTNVLTQVIHPGPAFRDTNIISYLSLSTLASLLPRNPDPPPVKNNIRID